MAQTVPIDIRAGISKTGVTFGATIYALDGSTLVTAFSATGWYEAPAGSGSFHHAGVSFPDAGGVIAYGVSGTEYNRFAVEQVKATPTNITAGVITTVTNLTNAPTVGDLTTTMKNSVTTAATAATPTAAAVSGSVGSVTSGVVVTTNNDKTGYALSSAGIQAIWDKLASALTTAGSIGKLITDFLDAAISSRMATFTYTAPPTAVQNRQEMDSNSTKLANLDATVSSRLPTTSYTAPTTPPTAVAIRTEIDNNSTQLAKLGAPANTTVSNDIAAVKVDTAATRTAVGTLPSAAAIASAVLAATLEGSVTVGRAMRRMLSVLSGKSTGGGTTTVSFRDQADTKDRVVATVDSNGNRTAVTTDDD